MNTKPVYDSDQEPNGFLVGLNRLLAYRDLVRNLIARDLKVRYKRSTLGFFWTMLNPLLTMGTLVIIFSTLFQTEIVHFPTYILSGLLVWNLFSQGSVAAMNSLLGNSSSLRKTYVPAAVFVLSGVGSALLNFIFALVPLIIFALIDGIRPTLNWLYTLVIIGQLSLLTVGVGLVVAALVVFYADFIEIYQVFLNLFFFLIPIMYPLKILSPQLLAFEQFNPLFFIVTGFRMVIIDNTIPSLEFVVYSSLAPIIILVLGWLFFTRVESRFAYYV